MSDYIKKIRTQTGDKQIDYSSLANLPVPDMTLSEEGRFADAAAVGKRLDDILNDTRIDLDGRFNLYADNDLQTGTRVPANGGGTYYNSGKSIQKNLTVGKEYIYATREEAKDYAYVGAVFLDADGAVISCASNSSLPWKNGYTKFRVPDNCETTMIAMEFNGQSIVDGFCLYEFNGTYDSKDSITGINGTEIVQDTSRYSSLNLLKTCPDIKYYATYVTPTGSGTGAGDYESLKPLDDFRDGRGFVLASIPIVGGKPYTFNILTKVNNYFAFTLENIKVGSYYMENLDTVTKTFDGADYEVATVYAPKTADRLWISVVNNSIGSTEEFCIIEGTSDFWAPNNYIAAKDNYKSLALASIESLMKKVNKWYGKKIVTLGDSITQGTRGGYVKYLQEKLCCEIVNPSYSGYTSGALVSIVTGYGGNRVYGDEIKVDVSNADACVIMIGTNGGVATSVFDDIPIIIGDTVETIANGGSITYNDNEISTVDEYWALFPDRYYSNLAMLIEYIQWKNPTCRIYLITILPTAFRGLTLDGGHTLVRKAMLEIGAYYGCTVIDAQQNCGINLHNIHQYTYDGTHLNELGNFVFGNYVADALMNS